jgi:hypothetical protein
MIDIYIYNENSLLYSFCITFISTDIDFFIFDVRINQIILISTAINIPVGGKKINRVFIYIYT